MKKRLFLLGGYDLEMLEIKKLLETHQENYKDNQLAWGAKLSSYSNELSFDGIIYGIELELDSELPPNYIEINHHGENTNKLSSLEQIAKILNKELTYAQKLIAANDRGSIKEMQKYCASPKEIDSIRQRDRVAQGVSQKDEELALESFKNSNSNLIYSLTSNFSLLSDLVYTKYDAYIIFNELTASFYGYKIQNVIKFLKMNSIKEDNFYYGGGEFGYLGLKDNIQNTDSLKKLLTRFIQMQTEKNTIHSYHTFMLPFVFTGNFQKKDNWIYNQFEINTTKDYNEKIYFYKHVQDALYNQKDEKHNDSISKYYEYKTTTGTYDISCKNGNFSLLVDGISLRIFNTNVAILSFNTLNNKYTNKNDILAINDYGRRIYPQFLDKESFTCGTKNAILANKLTLHLDEENPIQDDFSYFDNIQNIQKKVHKFPNFIEHIIKENFNKFDTIRPAIDDRMFVLSSYTNKESINALISYKKKKNHYTYENDSWWYKYIFVDGDYKTCQNKHMTKQFIEASTYARWVEDATLFGISRYSFVAHSSGYFGEKILPVHMQTMYFQIFTLLLSYRTSIIKFSDDIQNATQGEDKSTIQETRNLYKRYLDFSNKLYFKEVTAQEQGIELYNQAFKIMDIEKYMEDLENEINELNTYTELLEEKQRNKSLDFMSKLGAIFLPPSFITGLFGMNILTFDNSLWNETLGILLIILSSVIGYSFIPNSHKQNENTFFSRFKSTLKSYTLRLILLFICTFGIFFLFNDKKTVPYKNILKVQTEQLIKENCE